MMAHPIKKPETQEKTPKKRELTFSEQVRASRKARAGKSKQK